MGRRKEGLLSRRCVRAMEIIATHGAPCTLKDLGVIAAASDKSCGRRAPIKAATNNHALIDRLSNAVRLLVARGYVERMAIIKPVPGPNGGRPRMLYRPTEAGMRWYASLKQASIV